MTADTARIGPVAANGIWPATAADSIARSLTSTVPPLAMQVDGAWADFSSWNRRITETGCELASGDARVEIDLRRFEQHSAVRWIPRYGWHGQTRGPVMAALRSVDIDFAATNPATVYTARGSMHRQSDFMPLTRTLYPGAEVTYRPGGGRSSNEVMPFFTVDLGGYGFVLAVGWTGEWAAYFSHTGHSLRVRAGLVHTEFRLEPGETVRGPSIWLSFFTGDHIDGENGFRELVLEHARPNIGGSPAIAPVSAVTWGATSQDVHEAVIDQIAREAIPFEVYWVDAGWFDAGEVWFRRTGSWQPDPGAYPHGMRALSEKVRAAGMRFALWFEPERIAAGTEWHSLDPSWLLSIAGNDSLLGGVSDEEIAGWGLIHTADPDSAARDSRQPRMTTGDVILNLGNEAACDYVIDYISACIEQWGIDCYRQDANFAPLRFWSENDSPDRQGLTEMHYVEGLYRFWDALLQRHPDLVIDNCASGGRRIDIETMQRAISLSRSDYVSSSHANQFHTPALSRWVPLNAQIVVCPTTELEVQSGFSAGLSIGWGVEYNQIEKGALPGDFPFAEIRNCLTMYLTLRELYYGRLVPLTEPSLGDAWNAYQLDRPDLGRGAVIVTRTPTSPYTAATFRLRYLQPESLYEISGEHRPVTGRTLMERGIVVTPSAEWTAICYELVTASSKACM